MMTATSENNGSSKRLKAGRSAQPQSSHDSSSRERSPWQRSVKRRYEAVLERPKGSDRESATGTARDVYLERHSKGSGKSYPGTAEILHDRGTSKYSCQPYSSLSRDGPLSGVSGDSNKRFDIKRLVVNEGYNKGLQNLGQEVLNSSVEIEQFSQPAKDVLDPEWQRLHKKDGSQPMDRLNISRKKVPGRSGGFVDSNKGAQTLQSQNNQLGHASNYEIITLREALRAEKEALHSLYVDLEEERNASTSAANEAMAMIARLQEEKAAVLMEARQFKRMAEEKEVYGQEAITLLKEMLMKRDEDIMILQNELEACRQMFLKIEAEGWGKGLSYIKFLDKGEKGAGKNFLESEGAESIHFSEGLKSWTSSLWDSRDQSGTSAIKDTRGHPWVELTNSEVVAGRHGKHLITHSVRSNLISLFDHAGEVCEDPLANHAGDVKGEPSKGKGGFDRASPLPSWDSSSFTCDTSAGSGRNPLKRALSISEDGTYSSGGKLEAEEADLTGEDCSILLAQQSFNLNTGSRKVANTFPSEKKLVGSRIGPADSVREDSSLSVWERIMKLEERLDHFGGKQKCQDQGFDDADARILPDGLAFEGENCVTGSNQVASSGYKVIRESMHEQGQLLCDDVMVTAGCSYAAGRGAKNHCREDSPTLTTCRMSAAETSETGFNEPPRKYSQDAWRCSDMHCSSPFMESEESCNRRVADAEEGIHDVYEVQYELQQRSERQCPEFDVTENNDEDQYSNRLGKPDLPPRFTLQELENDDLRGSGAIFTEVERDQDSFFVREKCSAETKYNTSQTSLDVRDENESITGEEVQQLTLRLQALEAERVFMNQAIASLRKENGELKLLHEIAQQLRDLKGTVNNSEQQKEHSQLEHPSFLSFFKGILSFTGLQCHMHAHSSNLANAFQKNTVVGVTQRDHVGLCYLLEKSPQPRTGACVMRRSKVKFPIEREGTRLSQTPLLPQPAVH